MVDHRQHSTLYLDSLERLETHLSLQQLLSSDLMQVTWVVQTVSSPSTLQVLN